MKKISAFIVFITVVFIYWMCGKLDAFAAPNRDSVVPTRANYILYDTGRRKFVMEEDVDVACFYWTNNSSNGGFLSSSGKLVDGYYFDSYYSDLGYGDGPKRTFYTLPVFNSDYVIESTVPIFTNYSSAVAYAIGTGSLDDAVYAPESPIDYNPLNYDYDSRVEAPVVQYNAKRNSFTFANGSDGVGVTAYCRWLSVNDIYLDYDVSVGNLSGTLDWSMSVLDGKNRSFATYRDVVKSSFVESIPVTDGQPSTSSILLYPVTSGNSPFISSFNDLISVYPPSQRSITGRNNTNPLTGSNFAWFDNAEASLRESLGSFRNSLSVPEIYFRFYQVIDGELCFSKWTKFTMSLNMDKYTHDWTTYTDNEYGNDVTPPSYNTGVVDTNEPIVNNAPVSVGSNTQNTVSVNTQSNTVDININSVDWSQYIKTFQNSLGLFGNFTAFVSTVFTFLPSWIVAMLGSTVTLLCGLAVYHGIRG